MSAETTVDAAEIEKFARMADEWWDPRGKFRPLHVLNPLRIGVIRDAAIDAFGAFGSGYDARRPLAGRTLLDIGCGGGLIAEPMARLGAQVTGADASTVNISVARTHAAQSGLDIDYRATTAEALLEEDTGPFDIVLALEIVEHVAAPDLFLKTCARLLAPGGLLVVSTLNRTPKAFALAIVGAEYVLRWLPRGTHDWNRFLKPAEVAAPLEAQGLEVADPIGVVFDPFAGSWRLSSDISVNYMLTSRRHGETANTER